jgi:hypothetical protein
METTPATGTAERDAAITRLQRTVHKAGATRGGGKGYDTQKFVGRTREHGACPTRGAELTTNRRSAIDGRAAWHAGHAFSLRKRKQIDEAFGWIKTIGGMRKMHFVGQAWVSAQSLLTFAGLQLWCA